MKNEMNFSIRSEKKQKSFTHMYRKKSVRHLLKCSKNKSKKHTHSKIKTNRKGEFSPTDIFVFLLLVIAQKERKKRFISLQDYLNSES